MIFLTGAVSLLKLTAWCTTGGLIVTICNDKDVHKLVKRLGVKMVKKVKMFDIGNEHATILGATQYGKTYGTIKTLDNMNEAILFFNTNHTPLKGTKSKWYDAHGGNDSNQIIYALKQGYKINFLPADDVEKMEKQLKGLTDEIYRQGRGFNFRFVIDEVHLFKNEGKKALIRLATTGLGRGYKCIFISQRGALVDNNLFTQSTKHVLFTVGLSDYHYLKNLGFPTEKIQSITKNEKYIFAEFDQINVKGGFMIE